MSEESIRIISLLPSATEIVCALGLTEHLVGITHELCDVCALSYKTVERASQMFGGDVRVVSLEPNTIGDIFMNIRMVGELTGRDVEAERVVTELSARLERVERALV